MEKILMIRKEDLINNPTPRVPICLCLDTSDSMLRSVGGTLTGKTCYADGKLWNIATGGTTDLDRLQEGIKTFIDAIRSDDIALASADVAIVTYNDKAKCEMDFTSLEHVKDAPTLKAAGNTAMGEGINMALDLLEKRKAEYKETGVDYYQPWIVVMTDGIPNGDKMALNNAIARTREMTKKQKLTILPVGIGSEADMSVLNKLSVKQNAVKLDSANFKDLFEFLGQSVSEVSVSCPGEIYRLDTSKMKIWNTDAF